ncbi:CHAT domain-containing protein [Sphingobium boeckii]|uniref:CHAT domain-containing protein n=1 Tax=Sphingobium boeckii TaxID=1082345 RepID=A0A7W9AGT8_9SPHN|nr:CHAT domain-containing protein [Sphingobium boeckii]MBB5685448.1 CHAT domain-containing protein [Sphingobium boeckii]
MKRFLIALTGALLVASAGIAASTPRLSAEPGFRIGNAGVLCTAQGKSSDGAFRSMFDRGYAIVCRDAASAVGKLYVFADAKLSALDATAPGRNDAITCADARDEALDGLSHVRLHLCTLNAAKLPYRLYSVSRGGKLYVAEGLAGYDSALRLALKSIVLDRPALGEVQVAITTAGDPAAFARVQAGTLDPDEALAAAYGRNNSGSYAEAAEFFDILTEREAMAATGRRGEYLANQGLQQSNLRNFAEAESLLDQAAKDNAGDPVTGRLIRNYRAIHLLNQRDIKGALKLLDQPMERAATETQGAVSIARGEIGAPLAQQINRDAGAAATLSGIDSRLTPGERVIVLDAQATELRGVAFRLEHRYDEAASQLAAAQRILGSIRGGRLASTAWLRSEVGAEYAAIAEAQGDYGKAEAGFTDSMNAIGTEYPDSAALLSAKARLAAFLYRRGAIDRSAALYRDVVAQGETLPGSSAALATLLNPYFELLARRASSDAGAAADMFAASQTLLRPGVAQTQAVFARELSAGDDEGARLFRESVTLSREISRLRTEIARAAGQPAEEGAPPASAKADALNALESSQTALQAKLGAYPRFRVIDPAVLSLSAMQRLLRDGEAYYKLTIVGTRTYAIFVTSKRAQAFEVAITPAALTQTVAKLRDSITMIEADQRITYPFELAAARALYRALFDPIEGGIGAIDHLIFDPDGALLQLPVNLLPTEQAGVDAYLARIADPDADQFDFTGIAWLGRGRNISTAVSPRAFADLRAISPARGKQAYLGLGENAAPAGIPLQRSATRGMTSSGGEGCDWPLTEWGKPISALELRKAQGFFGQAGGEVVTGTAFSDTALIARRDLADYRVLHFATHGLVTAPRPECPARPALLTSFGGGASDGLLSFKEIYGLRLDADAVILSACDTAGAASMDATREAGLGTGGDFALDGLVRAFVGAGGRLVVASHWPIPDDFQATERLVSAMFSAAPGTPIASALRIGQQQLMDAPETSHPYYWSAFAIVGDGSKPLVRTD